MRDAGHRTPDAGHRTAKKAKIIYPPPRGVDIITCSSSKPWIINSGKAVSFCFSSFDFVRSYKCFVLSLKFSAAVDCALKIKPICTKNIMKLTNCQLQFPRWIALICCMTSHTVTGTMTYSNTIAKCTIPSQFISAYHIFFILISVEVLKCIFTHECSRLIDELS